MLLRLVIRTLEIIEDKMLVIDDVAVLRGERLVFSNLSQTVPSGGALVLVGPNGSGKSTLLRLLAGLVRPAVGRVLWNGVDVLSNAPAHGPQVAYLGHQDAVKLSLSAAENIRFTASVSGRPAWAALAALGLEELASHPARMLSAGQKRRLAMSRLTLSGARLWLLDEPTLGLDAVSIDRFGSMLAAHRKDGGIVVAATHVPLPLPDATEVRLS
jgi:heme exporter protein A